MWFLLGSYLVHIGCSQGSTRYRIMFPSGLLFGSCWFPSGLLVGSFGVRNGLVYGVRIWSVGGSHCFSIGFSVEFSFMPYCFGFVFGCVWSSCVWSSWFFIVFIFGVLFGYYCVFEFWGFI